MKEVADGDVPAQNLTSDSLSKQLCTAQQQTANRLAGERSGEIVEKNQILPYK